MTGETVRLHFARMLPGLSDVFVFSHQNGTFSDGVAGHVFLSHPGKDAAGSALRSLLCMITPGSSVICLKFLFISCNTAVCFVSWCFQLFSDMWGRAMFF